MFFSVIVPIYKVEDYLSNCTAVKEFSFAPPEDGGSGKTYVTLA